MTRLLALAALAFAAASTAQAGDGIVVAFRADAAPFSASAGDGYEGYIAGLCEAAVARTDYRIAERRPVTAVDRSSVGDDVALVCDPTTITVARARRSDFSPIVYIANSGFLRAARPHVLSEAEIARSPACAALHAERPDRSLVGVGMVVDTTARATFELARSTGRLGDTLDHALCVVELDSHAEGVAEVCGGHLTYYFGDVDIMVHEMQRTATCAASRVEDFGAYEPYAVRLPNADEGFRRAFVAALYGLFADGTALAIYAEAFGTDRLSEPLRMLFSVNNVPLGDAATD